jgi:hypothetical protein
MQYRPQQSAWEMNPLLMAVVAAPTNESSV